jgi:hypothetical protein
MILPRYSGRIAAWATLSMAAVGWGQVAPSGIEVRAVRGAFRTTPESAVNVVQRIHDVANDTITLRGARNEVLGFNLLIAARGGPETGITVDVAPFMGARGTASDLTTELYRVYAMNTGPTPGWLRKTFAPATLPKSVNDFLVPIDAPAAGQPYDLMGNEPVPLWVDVSIPTSAQPGTYTTTVTVSSQGRAPIALTLEIEVWPFALPDGIGPALIAPVQLQRLLGHHLALDGVPYEPPRVLQGSPLYDEAVGLIHQTLWMLQRHRLTPVIQGLYPIERRNDFGEVIVDWQDYDRIVAPYLNGELYPDQPRPQFWPVPFDREFPTHPGYDPLGSPKYNRELRQYLTLCAEHFTEQQWLARSYTVLPDSHLLTVAGGATAQHFAELIQLASSRLPVMAMRPPQDMRRLGWRDYPYVDLRGRVDIWCPSAQLLDPRVFGEPHLRKQRSWMQLDRPPFSGSLALNAPDTFVRVIPWQADALGAEAVMLPIANAWTPPGPHHDIIAELGQTPTPLILPGRPFGLDRPLPTLRLKALRRGMQDIAYLRLCRQSGQFKVADVVAGALCRVAGANAYGAHFDDGQMDAWTHDAGWWDPAIWQLGRVLETVSDLNNAEQPDRFNSVDWQWFLSATQQIRVDTIGVQVRRRTPQEPFNVVALLSVSNDTPEPVSGSLSFENLPMGWQPQTRNVGLRGIPARSTHVTALSAVADAIPAEENGKLTLPAVIETAGGAHREVALTVAHVAAQRLFKPITIDGKFDDWPVAVGNTAGDFVQFNSAGGPPGSQTLVLVGYNNTHLYFGVHCLTPSRHILSDSQRNTIAYDERVPTDDEVFEILIDPSNDRSSSPGDLYHLAIKPSGVTLQEHGIRAHPQVGHHGHWTTDIDVFTRILDDRWVAEVRMPLSDFGPRTTTTSTWGLNLTRYERATGIYSNWAGARWNTHNPASLGNLSFGN